MTVKEQLHELVDGLDETGESLALGYLMRITGRSNGRNSLATPEDDLRVGVQNVADVDTLSFDDPLWGLVGIVDDDGPTDVSTNADKYLADYYADNHDK